MFEGKVVHDPKCRPGRPLCPWRRKATVCHCSALHYPHRKGSVRGCREGGVPEKLVREGYLDEPRAGTGYPTEWDLVGERRRSFTRTRSTRGRWG